MSDRGTDGRRRLGHLAVDMSEIVDGYQFDGRGRAIQQWRERKEKQEFAALCSRLNVLKWQREVYAEGGERLERLRARKREWMAQKRLNAEPRPIEIASCPVCATTWRVDPSKPGRKRVFCSRRCEYKARYKSRPRVCGKCGQPGHNVRTCGNLEAG